MRGRSTAGHARLLRATYVQHQALSGHHDAVVLPFRSDLVQLAQSEKLQLEQVIAQRQVVQQRISEWIAQMREEMQTVSQNSRLLKTYTS